MKLIKLLSLTIVLLLNCFISYCQNCDYINNDSIQNINSFTGNEIKSDTTTDVSISDIRKVNKALIERKYYKEIINTQDSIIILKDDYILEQNKVIDDLQDRIVQTTDINNKLKEDYNRQKNKTLIAGSIAGSLGVCLIGSIVAIVLIK